ncbi:MAG: hypothetical protein FWG59_00660, partial [Betaproteobacteria bacterium]|nr:hypothetical protein [Betaproteobacteria bacterium]
MTTKYKVIVGFLLMTALLIAVAVVGYLKLHQATGGFVAYRVEARTAAIANGADARVRAVQDQFSRFRLDIDQAHVKEASRYADLALNTYLLKARELETTPSDQALLDKQIARFKQFMQLSDVMQQKLSAATKEVDGPLTDLSQAINDGLSEMSTGARKANNINLLPSIDAAYSAFYDASVSVRYYADIFLESAEVKAEQKIAGLGAALKNMEQVLVAEENKASFAKLYKTYTSYVEGFKSAKKLLQEGIEAQRQMDILADDMRKDFNEYTARSEKNMDTIGPAVQASNEQAETLITVVSAVGVVLGILFALFIIFGLIRVLKDLGVFAKAVAEGDFDHQIKTREKGEIGDMVQNMLQIPAVLNSILNDYQTLEKRIEAGELEAKGDPATYKGGFSTLIAGTNAILSRFLLLVENIPSPVVMLDKELKAAYLNAVGREVAGAAWKGKTCKQLMDR